MQTRPDANAEAAGTGGPAVSLWLLAVLIAEAEALLWILGRAYGS